MKQHTPTVLIVLACMVGSALFTFSLTVLIGALSGGGLAPITAAIYAGLGALLGAGLASAAVRPIDGRQASA